MGADVYSSDRARESASAWQRGRFDSALRKLTGSGLIPEVTRVARAVPGASAVVYTEYEGVDGKGLRYPRVSLFGPWSHRPGEEEPPTRLRLIFWADESEVGGLNLTGREDRQQPFVSPTKTVAIIHNVTLPQAREILAAFIANPSREGLSSLLQPNPSSPSHRR